VEDLGKQRIYEVHRQKSRHDRRACASSNMRFLSWMEKCPICHIRQRLGYSINIYYKLETCKGEKREGATIEIEKL
jgi:hypothetical protein